MDTILPFARNKTFVDRNDIFTQIQDSLQRSNTASLVGLGGMGKTQIALEYAHRYKSQHPKSKVFWIRASRQDLLLQDFQNIAESFGLKGRYRCCCQNVVQLVYDWLLYLQHDPWFLIFDDMNEKILLDLPTLLTSSNNAHSRRSSNPPPSSKGTLLTTAKDVNTAVYLTSNPKTIIKVDGMTEPQAIALILATSHSSYSTTPKHLGQWAKQLANELDNIPLAITQATSYMGSHLSIPSYLSLLNKSPQLRLLLLDYEAPNPYREASPSNAILKTLWISFQGAARVGGNGVLEAMALLSDCAQQSLLPREFLSGKKCFRDEEVIGVLVDYCIVGFDERMGGFRIHDVVRLSLREWFRSCRDL